MAAALATDADRIWRRNVRMRRRIPWRVRAAQRANTVFCIRDAQAILTNDDIGYLMSALGRDNHFGGPDGLVGGTPYKTFPKAFCYTRFTHLVVTGRTLTVLPAPPNREWTPQEVWALVMKVQDSGHWSPARTICVRCSGRTLRDGATRGAGGRGGRRTLCCTFSRARRGCRGRAMAARASGDMLWLRRTLLRRTTVWRFR